MSRWRLDPDAIYDNVATAVATPADRLSVSFERNFRLLRFIPCSGNCDLIWLPGFVVSPKRGARSYGASGRQA